MFHGSKAELSNEEDGGDDIDPSEDNGNAGRKWAGSDGCSGQTQHARPNGGPNDQADGTPEALLLRLSL